MILLKAQNITLNKYVVDKSSTISDPPQCPLTLYQDFFYSYHNSAAFYLDKFNLFCSVNFTII